MSDPDDTRMRLRKHRLTYVWLICQLALRGINTDKTEVSSVYNGTRKGAKAECILKTSGKILDDYEEHYLGNTASEGDNK